MSPSTKILPIFPVLATFAALTIWALTSPAHAYRTAADLPEVMSEAPVVWRGEVELSLDLTAFDSAERGVIRSAVRRAIRHWNEVDCADTQLILVNAVGQPNDSDGVNSIVWIDDWQQREFERTAMASTDTQYQVDAAGNWSIAESDIWFNRHGFRWSSSMLEGEQIRSIEAVLTHELGHLLGLAHSCGDTGAPSCDDPEFGDATMNPAYRGPEQATLEPDDIAGICSLYPRSLRCIEDVECRGLETCNDGFCKDLCEDVSCVDGAICSRGVCESLCDDCDTCSSNQECGGRQFCSANRCVTAFTGGEPCSG